MCTDNAAMVGSHGLVPAALGRPTAVSTPPPSPTCGLVFDNA